jgi:hypothetical protein
MESTLKDSNVSAQLIVSLLTSRAFPACCGRFKVDISVTMNNSLLWLILLLVKAKTKID